MFTCPVSMKIPSQKHYERDLEQQLLKLGYEIYRSCEWSVDCPYLITGYIWSEVERKQIGFNQSHSSHKNTYRIDTYNPELFLALAGLTDDPNIKEGDWVRNIEESVDYRRGVIYRVDKFDCVKGIIKSSTSSPTPFAGKHISHFRKATKEEIIQHFNKPRPSPSITPSFTTDSDTSSSSMETKSTMKTRILKREDFIKYYPNLCTEWKTKLKAAFSDFAVKDTVEVSDELYEEMRRRADNVWSYILDQLFGKEDNLALKNLSNKISEFEEFCEKIGLDRNAIQPAMGVLYSSDERQYRSLYFSDRYDWKFDEERRVLTPYIKR